MEGSRKIIWTIQCGVT